MGKPQKVRRRHRTKSKDPFVPINGVVVRAALAEQRSGPTQLGRDTGASQQRISAILNSGSDATCRSALRRQIAKVLGVAEEMLSGMPVIPPDAPFVARGYEYRYSIRTEFAASRLLTLAAKAIERDLADAADSGAQQPWPPPRLVLTQGLNWIGELVQVRPWRQKFLCWNPDIEASRGFTEPPTVDAWNTPFSWRGVAPGERKRSRLPKGTVVVGGFDATQPIRVDDPDHEAAILGLLKAVEHVLRPWFEGHAKLNYAALRDFAHLSAKPASTSPVAVFPPAIIAWTKKRTKAHRAAPRPRARPPREKS